MARLITMFVFFWFNQLIWNWVASPLFHLPEVTYWQMAALTCLGRNMFSRYYVKTEASE